MAHLYGILVIGSEDRFYVTKAQAEAFEVLTDFDIEIPVHRAILLTDKRGNKKPIFDQYLKAIIVEDTDWQPIHTNIINGARDAWNAAESFQIPTDLTLIGTKEGFWWNWYRNKLEQFKI